MVGTTTTSHAGLSSNDLVNGVLWDGWRWSPPGTNTLSYWLSSDSGRAWSVDEAVAYQRALSAWSAVANITFTAASSRDTADLVETIVTSAQMRTISGLSSVIAFHETPEDAAVAHVQGIDTTHVAAFAVGQAGGYYNFQSLGQTAGWTADQLSPGAYFASIFIHELGHALGLKHPHDIVGAAPTFPGVLAGGTRQLGDNAQNHQLFTVMSYNANYGFDADGRLQLASGPSIPSSNLGLGLTTWGYATGPMAYDIAAAQFLYGANATANNGDTVYDLPAADSTGTGWSSIWDTGGIDTVRHIGATRAIIDLNAATLDGTLAGGGAPSYARGIHGGYTIANGVAIENAVGGEGADEIVGNTLANRLTGRGGADRMTGGAGADTFAFLARSDSNALAGIDTITDFEHGVDRIDLSALGIDAAHLSISFTTAGAELQVRNDPSSFNPASDLSILLAGANDFAISDVLGLVGGTAMVTPINNYQSSLVMTQSIALQGIFPSPNFGGDEYIGAIHTFAGNFASVGYATAGGGLLPINQNQALFALLGTTYGGNGLQTFALPNLAGRTMIGTGTGPGLATTTLGEANGTSSITLTDANLPIPAGGGQAFNDEQPSLGITYAIALQGIFPSRAFDPGTAVATIEPFLGEVGAFAQGFVPRGWAACEGQLLSIAQHTALFAIIGTTFGGDGRTTFALPDLRGRTIIGTGNGFSVGQSVGQENHTLGGADAPPPAGGSGAPVNNMQPSLAMSYLIALDGIFPSRASGTQPGIGEVIAFAGNFAPQGWAFCDGSLLPIAQNQALFALIGTMYGGDGQTTFALPDLRGKTILGAGTFGGETFDVGEQVGSNTFVLTGANIQDDVIVTGTGNNPAVPTDLRGDGNDYNQHFIAQGPNAHKLVSYETSATGVIVNLNVNTTSASGATGGFARGDWFTGITDLTGSNQADSLTALVGTAAVLNGLGGADRLVGSSQRDTLIGGAGADEFSAGDGDDTLIIDAADLAATMLGGQGFDYAIAEGGVGLNLILTTANGIERVIATDVDDSVDMSATTVATYLSGKDGIDTLRLGTGGGWADGGNGADNLYDGSAGNGVPGDTAFDILIGGAGADLLDGSKGGYNLHYGGTGTDNILGGNGRDVIFGEADADTVDAGGGNDTVYVDAADVLADVKGGAGFDDIILTEARTAVFTDANGFEGVVCSSGGDTIDLRALTAPITYLAGGSGGDTLFLANGGGSLSGRGGGDRLVGGLNGSNHMEGGIGADSFVVGLADAGFNIDYIYDFSRADGDKIDLTQAGVADFGRLAFDTVATPGWTAVSVDGLLAFRVQGAIALVASDFVF